MTEECRLRTAGWWFAAAFGVIVAVALAMPGMARASSIATPDDVHGKLDIASVSQEHGTTGRSSTRSRRTGRGAAARSLCAAIRSS